TSNSFTFDAERHSNSAVPGIAFFRNRVYDQTTGRWTQEDPLGVAGGLNLYQFNGNNPSSFTDPFGLCPDPEDATCQAFKSGMILLGATAGFIVGGGAGALETVASGGLLAPVAVAQTAATTATG